MASVGILFWDDNDGSGGLLDVASFGESSSSASAFSPDLFLNFSNSPKNT